MSAALLSRIASLHRVSDDLEAFVHVVVLMAARFHEHALTIDVPALSSSLEAYFDTFDLTDGGAKLMFIKKASPPIELLDENSPLFHLLQQLFQLCKQHYLAAGFLRPPTITNNDTDPEVRNSRKRYYRAIVTDEDVFGNPNADPSSSSAQTNLNNSPLMNHDAIMKLFRCFLNPENWPEGDKTKDQFKHLSRSVQQAFRTKSTAPPSSAIPGASSSAAAPGRPYKKPKV